MNLSEFEIIDCYFKQPFKNLEEFRVQKQANEPKVSLAIGDDCCGIESNENYEIVISSDHFVESVHFFSELSPNLIAKKALTRALSDLMAMGAKPLGFTLALATNKTNYKWFEKFSSGLVLKAKEYQIPLIGGDLSFNQNTTISIQVMGFCLKNQILKRNQLKINDLVYATGTIGFSGYVLNLLKNKQKVSEQLLKKYYEPKLALNFASQIAKFKGAGIDVSDGLFQDLNHLMQSSDCGLKIDMNAIEKSLLANELKTNEKMNLETLISLLNQGDDYEFIFSVPEKHKQETEAIAKKTGTKITQIGEAINGRKMVIDYDGKSLEAEKNLQGYRHF